MTKKLGRTLLSHVKTAFLTATLFCVIRVLEFLYAITQSSVDLTIGLFFERSLNFDLLVVCQVFLFALFPVLAIGVFSPTLSRIFSRLVGLVLVVVDLLLTSYFLVNNSLLGCILFEFSASDLLQIISNEFAVNRLNLWFIFIVLLIASLLTLFYVQPKWKTGKVPSVFLILCFVASSVGAVFNLPPRLKAITHFETRFHYHIGNSKLIYLWSSCQASKLDEGNDFMDVKESVETYQESNPYFDYVDEQYPLLHNTRYENVLEPYFTDDSVPPNIVIVISESLSASFFSENWNGQNRGLVPFTDSLASVGLYWSNFFSNAERSYAVLPNVLSSLPFGLGNRGFINMKYEYASLRSYPLHSGLIPILKKNGYVTNYFYGGWGGFDNVNVFLKESGIDNFISYESFDTEQFSQTEDGWGYHDKDLFRKSISFMESKRNDKPYLNIYQTISLHSPFNLAEEKYFEASYLSQKLKTLGFEDGSIEGIENNVLSTIFFSDDALADLMKEYSKRDDFERTIFLITGDHGIDRNLSNHVFESFQVPLIIYSPLLKGRANFQGASSHVDILPSLLSLLEQNFSLNVPSEKHWIGQGLDTNSNCEFDRIIPLLIGSSDMPNLLFNDTLIYANSLWKVECDLSIQKLESISNSGADNFYSSYQDVNSYVCKHDKIRKPKTPLNSN